MAEKNLYKIIASFVAIFAYLFLIFSVMTFIKEEAKFKKDYGFNVEDAIVVNIDSLIKEKPQPIEKLKPEPIAKPVIKPIVLPPEPEPIKPEPIILPPDPEPIILPPDPEPEPEVEKESRDLVAKSAKDLFSTLRVDDYKKAMAEKRKQEEARASRLKKQKAQKAKKKADAKRKKEEKRRKKEAQEAQRLVEQMQISTPSNHKKSGENHAFWSFVSNKIMSKWQRTVSTQDGLSATVTIRINNQGRLSYSDSQSSYNSLFDTKLKLSRNTLSFVSKRELYEDCKSL